MAVLRLLAITIFILGVSYAQQQPSAVEVLQDMYGTCLKEFSLGCIKPKALSWISNVVDQPVIKITDDLEIVKTDEPEHVEVI